MKVFLKEFLKINLIAVLIGSFISFFLFFLSKTVELNDYLIKNNSLFIMIIMIIVFTFIAYYRLKRDKNVLGSGIPQLEDYLAGHRELKFIPTFLDMFLVCAITFFGGLGLGSEGPSVYFGGLIGIAINKYFKEENKKEIVAISGACGFGCAFLSPCAAFFYAFEELGLKIKVTHVIKCAYICFLGYFMTNLIYGHKIIYFEISDCIELKYLWTFILLGVVVSLVSYLFVFMIIKTKDLVGKIKFKQAFIVKLLLCSLLSFLTVYFLNKLSGSGVKAFSVIIQNDLIKTGVFILVFRILFTSISASSSMSGGLVIPMFVVGACVGNLVFIVCKHWFGIDDVFNAVFIVCAMVCLFGASTKTFITTIFLSFTFISFKVVILPILITVSVSYFVSKLLKQEDIYHLLLKRLK